MRSRKTLILLAALLLLAAVAVFTERPWRGGRKDTDGSPALLPGAGEEITRVEIGDTGREVVLRRAKGGWEAGAAGNFRPADPDGVKRLLEAVDGLKEAALVSRNPSNRAGYQVDDAGGLRVALFAGNRRLAEIIVGGQGPDLFSSYVRAAGRPEVLIARGYLRPFLARPLKSWWDMNILSFPAEEAVEMEVSRPEGRIVLGREGGRWGITAPSAAEADQQAADELLSRLGTLRAVDIVEVKVTDPGFDAPSLKLTVKLKDGSLREAVLGKLDKERNMYYARGGVPETIYLIGRQIAGDVASILPRLAKE